MLTSLANPAAMDDARPSGGGFASCALLLLIMLGLMPGVSDTLVHAGEGDTLRPYLSASVGVDSNLFRFANDAQAINSSIGEPIRSITYQRYGAGIDVDWQRGRQQFIGRLGADRTMFSRYANLLDYSGQDLRAEWRWQVGNRWSGQLSGARDRSQSPFTDHFGGTLSSNVTTDDSYVFQADYWFHSEWRARMRLNHRGRDWGKQRERNNTVRTSTFGLYRQGGTLTNVGVEFSDIDIEFPNRLPPFTTLDKRADEQIVRLLASWSPSTKTRLNGHIGHAQRKNANVKNRDFSGTEWRLAATWIPTGKTSLEATLSRDLNVSETADANYELVDAFNLAAVWQALPKIRLIGQAGYQRFRYDGAGRQDNLPSFGLSASYELWPGSELSAGYRHTKRDSNLATREFESDTLFISANLRF